MVLDYFKQVVHGLYTVLVGMKITWRYLWVKPVTLQYPEEIWHVPDGYRGYHEYSEARCIGCFICVKACPVDCISMDITRQSGGKKAIIHSYVIDFTKCIFCNLCCEPCPTEPKSIWMGKAYDMSVLAEDKDKLVVDYCKLKTEYIPWAVGEHIPPYKPGSDDKAPEPKAAVPAGKGA
ncbi:MAG: 4Fe-4S dicluster domain-containing protein [Planctomycetota bacterium]